MKAQEDTLKRIFILYFFDNAGNRNELIYRSAEKAQEHERFCREQGIKAYVRMDSFTEEYDNAEWLICAMAGKQYSK